MFRSARKCLAFVLFVVFALSLASVASAEPSRSDKSVTGFLRNLFNFSATTTTETGKMAGNAVKNTGEKVVQPAGENTAKVLTGDVAKTADVVVQPTVGAANTVGQAAAETVQAPVKAMDEVKAGQKSAPEAPAAK